ncbi:hypothetical protein, partial [Staphylococcus epidermidis]|uniref:hypothetical protein n=1 Tax=Staphylococcus epidermidis TaxID=1282 RepID=UPI00119E1863
MVRGRSEYNVKKARDGADIVEGLGIAVDDIDEIMRRIGEWESDKIGMGSLEEGFKVSEGE